MKAIYDSYKKVFSCNYQDIDLIMCIHDPDDIRVFGWDCDIRVDHARNIAITTGLFHAFGEAIPSELLKKYQDTAEEILNKYGWALDIPTRTELKMNEEKFWNALDRL
jgi:hypothetical protein